MNDTPQDQTGGEPNGNPQGNPGQQPNPDAGPTIHPAPEPPTPEQQAQTIMPQSDDDKTMGMLAHLLGILGFLGPLIIWLIKKDESPFVDFHGKESLNFQITFIIAVLAASVLAAIPVVGCIACIIFPALLIVDIVFCVMAAMAAKDGKLYRYPITIRFIS